MSPAGRVKPDRGWVAWLLGVGVGCALIVAGLVVLQGSVLPFRGWPSPDRHRVGQLALADQPPAESDSSSASAGEGTGGAAFASVPSIGRGVVGVGLPGDSAGSFGQPLESTAPSSSETVGPPPGAPVASNQGTGSAGGSQTEITPPLDVTGDVPVTIADLGSTVDQSTGSGQDPRLSRAKPERGDDDPPADEQPPPSDADNPPPVDDGQPTDVPGGAGGDQPPVSEPPITVPSQPGDTSPPPVIEPTPGSNGGTDTPPVVSDPPTQTDTPPTQGETPPTQSDGTGDQAQPSPGQTDDSQAQGDDDDGHHHSHDDDHESDCD